MMPDFCEQEVHDGPHDDHCDAGDPERRVDRAIRDGSLSGELSASLLEKIIGKASGVQRISSSSFMDRRKSHVAAGPSERLGL
jgi:hypothetical protein